MPDLSVQNIEQVRNDICRQEISFSHLLDELIDHVCCDIESEMLSGLSFSDAYQKVKMKFGPDQFSQIQKDTLYAVDLKYRNMRNTMKISGMAGIILLSFGALFKIQHWPLAGVLMTLGAFILAFIFLPSSLGVLWKETHNKRRIFLFVSAFITGAFFIAGTLFKVQHWPAAAFVLLISFASALFMFFPSIISMIFRDEDSRRFRGVALTGSAGAILYIAGMLFKIQHWPLSDILILLGIIILAFIALPWYTRLCWKDERAVNPKFIFLIVACVSIVVPGALINLNLQYGYKVGYIFNNDRQEAFSNYLSENNSALAGYVTDTSVMNKTRRIQANTVLLLDQIKAIEGKMEGQEREQLAVSEYLLAGSASRQELDGMIVEYMNFMSEYLPEQFINIINPSRVLSSKDDKAISPLSGLNSLALIKSSVLACENAAIKSLININNNSSTAK
jgi:hypothetical protein